MNKDFSSSEGYRIIDEIIKVIQSNKNYLSEIDGAIGDGDHGINMNKGVTKCQKKLEGKQVTLSDGFKTLGMTLLTEIGGAMGPLFGTFFLEMSKAAEGHENINETVFSEILNSGLKGVQDIDSENAKVGDKTLIDTLVPAIKAYDNAIQKGKDFTHALEDLKVAAEKGTESTKDLVAKIGRASRLGERSRGVMDPGATSANLILRAISDTIISCFNNPDRV
jgi:phosphoenolpyruvate---glycerone phosphotransferase subunit DhaL